MSQIDPLQALLNVAMAEAYTKKVKGTPSKESKAEKSHRVRPEKRFSDPARWTKVRTVSFIHTDSSTLLGNFHEFIHDSFSARKWERVEGPCETD